MKKNDWKDRLNIVYSTNSNFTYETEKEHEENTLPKNEQKLRVRIEKNHRGGKTATIISGFIGNNEDLKELGKSLKTKCGVGGTVKDGILLIQGEFKEKIIELLKKDGYTQTK